MTGNRDLLSLNCAVSVKDVENADKAAAAHRASKKEGTIPTRSTLSVLETKVKRHRNSELPFGKYAAVHKLATVCEGRGRIISGEKGFIFLHESYSYCLDFTGSRADARQVRAVVEGTGTPLLSANRM